MVKRVAAAAGVVEVAAKTEENAVIEIEGVVQDLLKEQVVGHHGVTRRKAVKTKMPRLSRHLLLL